ncbi:unnamed protein product, partial [Allacma fusca]
MFGLHEMFLQSNKPVRITTAAKARLNTQTRKIDNIESRKRSPEGYPGPPSIAKLCRVVVKSQMFAIGLPNPSSCNEVMVFTNSHGHGRSGHNSRSLPEYPNIDEMQRYLQEVWDQKMRELNDPNTKLKYLHLGHPKEKSNRKETSPTSSQPATPVKQRSSPLHNSK